MGGGNLSFELSFAKKHPRLANDMVATTYEPIHALTEEAIINKGELESLGVKVYHKIDATSLHSLDFFYKMNPKHIYFSHPYSAEEDFSTSDLIENFFYSVSCSNVMDCKIHIIRLRGGDYEMNKPESEREFYKLKDYDLIKHYKELYGFYEISFFNFILDAKHRFNTGRYPGYNHSKTVDSTCSAPMVGGNNSLNMFLLKKMLMKSLLRQVTFLRILTPIVKVTLRNNWRVVTSHRCVTDDKEAELTCNSQDLF